MKTIADILEIYNLETLTETDLSNIEFGDVSLTHSKLVNVDFSNKNLNGINLSYSQIQDCKFINANLKKANLKHCDFYSFGRVDFSNADLSEATLYATMGSLLRFDNANLSNTMFKYSKLDFVHFDNANLTNANLAETNLEYGHFNFANVSNANLSNAYLREADLSGANFSNANLSGVDLIKANLSGANLTNADLTNADLRHADLSGAILTGAKGVTADIVNDKTILKGMAGIVFSNPERLLEMSAPHSECGQNHSFAGWIISLHPNGSTLEKELGTKAAAQQILTNGDQYPREATLKALTFLNKSRKEVLGYLSEFM